MSEITNTGVLFITMLSMAACAAADEPITHVSPEALAGLSEDEMALADVQAAYEEFKALSAGELDVFNDARERVEFSTVTALLERSEPLTQANLDALEQELQAVNRLRRELNQLSMERLGTPYNQIDGQQLDSLFGALAGDYSMLGIGRSEDKAQLASCGEPQSYPLTAHVTGPTLRIGTGWSTYYENKVAQDAEQDCDLIYAYPGTFTRMRPLDLADWQLMAWLGGQTRMRHTGYTDIQLGSKVWVVYGHPALVSLRMY